MNEFYDYKLEGDLANVFNKINEHQNQKLLLRTFKFQPDYKFLLHRPIVTSENIKDIGIAFFGLNSYSDDLKYFSDDTNFTVEVQNYYGKLKSVIKNYEDKLHMESKSYYSNFYKIVLPENSFKKETGLNNKNPNVVKLFKDMMIEEIKYLRSKYCKYFIFFGNKCWDLTTVVREYFLNKNKMVSVKNEVLIKVTDKDSDYYFVWEKHFSRFSYEASDKVLEWIKEMK